MSHLLTITIANVQVQGYGTLKGIDLETVRDVGHTAHQHGGREQQVPCMGSRGASLQYLFMTRSHAEQCATVLTLTYDHVSCIHGPYRNGAMI